MKVLWVTHRKFDDFCATTPIALASGLVELGFDLTIMNPQEDGSHGDSVWKHIGLETNAVRVFKVDLSRRRFSHTSNRSSWNLMHTSWIGKLVPKLENSLRTRIVPVS